jgi:multiple sugar transport system permease protein
MTAVAEKRPAVKPVVRPAGPPLGEKIRIWVASVFAWGLVAILAFPLYWMVLSSLRASDKIFDRPVSLLPTGLSLENYRVLADVGFGTWFLNSAIVTVGTVIPVIVVGTLGAYSLTRFKYPGGRQFSLTVLLVHMFPSTLMMVPLFLVINRIGLGDSYGGLILANMTYSLPFAMWLLRSYFMSINHEVEQAAMVDGASRLRAFWDVVIPQAAPGIVSTAMFASINAWNNYLFALIFISSPSKYTLPLGISRYSNSVDIQWGPLLASAVLATLPVLVVFGLLQRRFFSGFGVGSR